MSEPDRAGTVGDGRYELVSRLQRTPGDETFRARDVLLDRVVTVVVHRGTEEVVADRWTREVRALHEVEHAHVAGLCDGGRVDGGAYSVLRVASAGVLRDVACRRPGPDQVARWCGGLAAGLGRLHEHGVVHGAIGPDAVLLDDDGAARWFRVASAVHDAHDPAGRESDVRALRDLAAELIGVPLRESDAAELEALLRAATESSAWLLAGTDDIPLDGLAALVRRARRSRWRSAWWRR